MSGEATPERLHGFDAVRGLAAVAVVALHASYAHSLFPLPGLVWPVPLDQPSRITDATFWWIEGSVMPLFFTLSGYFLVRSFARQPPGAVLAGRTRRLLLPMATVGFAVLTLDLHVWVLGLIASGRASVSDYRRLKFAPAIQGDLFGPAHLWYVEYLWLLCALASGIVWIIGRVGGTPFANRPEAPPRRSWAWYLPATAVLGISIALAALLSLRPQIVLGFQHGWLPHPGKLAHAGLFVMIGVLIYRTRGTTELLRRFAPLSLLVAAAAFGFVLPRIHEAMRAGRASEFDPVLGVLLATFAVAATVGQIGAGLRWLNRPNPALARLAAASFWIYLVHHPLLGLAQVVLRPVPVAAELKCGLVIVGVLGLCVWSYSRFVEGRAIGRLLEGEWPWRAFRASEAAILPMPAAKDRKAA